MQAKTLTHYLLLALGLTAFVAQTVSAGTPHRHAEKHSEPEIAMTAHHQHDQHEVMMELPANQHPAMHHTAMDGGDQPAHKQSGHSDCCDDQCQCGLATCSVLYAVASQAWLPLAELAPRFSHAQTDYTNSPATALFRPPIRQYA